MLLWYMYTYTYMLTICPNEIYTFLYNERHISSTTSCFKSHSFSQTSAKHSSSYRLNGWDKSLLATECKTDMATEDSYSTVPFIFITHMFMTILCWTANSASNLTFRGHCYWIIKWHNHFEDNIYRSFPKWLDRVTKVVSVNWSGNKM